MTRVTPQPGRRLDVQGGTCSAIIDLANPAEPERGGHDPAAPQSRGTLLVSGRLLRVGHTWALSDPDEPVFIDASADVHPGGRAAADLRCTGCVARVDIGRLDGDTLAVLEHERGCRWLRKFLARRTP